MSTPYKHIEVVPFADAPFGAQIRGVSMAKPPSAPELRELERAYSEFALLLFRKQAITPDQQILFSRCFGELEQHVFSHWCLPDHPEILVVSNVQLNGEPVGVYNAGRYWHTDLSYMQAPSRGSLLYALEVPEADGQPLGNTYFASAAAAYASLPVATRERIHGLTGEFSLAHQRGKLMADGDQRARLSAAEAAATPTAVHALVQRHPVTQKPLLYVNEGHTQAIEGLSDQESTELLAELCGHITRDENVYCHRWRVGDVLMWDNIATQHLATFDYALPQRRLMHRTTIRGELLG